MSTVSPDAEYARHRTHELPGRPYRLSVRLSAAERELVAAAAIGARLTPSGFAGKAAVAAATQQSGLTAGLPDALRQLQAELFAARRAVAMFGTNVNQAAAAFNATGELPDWFGEAVALCRAAVGRLDEVTGRIDRRLR